jgi:hypothetical protein
MQQQAQRQPQVVPRAAAAAAAADLAALDLSSSIETDPGRNDLEVRSANACLLQCVSSAVNILGAVLNRPAVAVVCLCTLQPVCVMVGTLQAACSFLCCVTLTFLSSFVPRYVISCLSPRCVSPGCSADQG